MDSGNIRGSQIKLKGAVLKHPAVRSGGRNITTPNSYRESASGVFLLRRFLIQRMRFEALEAGFDVDTGPLGSIDHLIPGFSSILQTELKRVQFEIYGHQVDIGFQHVGGLGG